MIRVLIADDHTVFRQGIRRLLDDTDDIEVVGEASTGVEALAAARALEPNVLLLDINLPKRSGLEVLKQLKAERLAVPVLILSMFPEEQYAVQALKAGAAGYLTKGHDSDEIIAAIGKVAAGGRYATVGLIEKLLPHLDPDPVRLPHQKLSPREYEIFTLITNGKSLTDIGASLSVSVSTVSTYRRRILEKMGMESNAELIGYAFTHGLRE